MEINIEGVRKFDLQITTDAIDYLCYLTEDKITLINLVLFNSPDKKLLGDFQKDFFNEKRDNYKYILCYHYSNDFYLTFVNPANKFIFNNYINNLNSTDLGKKSRLNLLLNNIDNLTKEISVNTQKVNFDKPNYQNISELEKEFEIRFKSTYFISQDYNSQPLKVYSYPFNLLLFCLGISLKKIYDKLMLEYSACIDNLLISQNSINSTILSPNEKITSRNEILQILFKNDFNNSEKFIKCEDKLISHGYLNADKSQWIKEPSDLIRFYTYCEKNLLRKGIYEKNSKGIQYFRCLYDFHVGKGIDVPSKRKKQSTPLTKHDFDFLDF